LTSNLRYGAGYATPDPATFFDYTEGGGMGRAVEMCSGLGVCRKTLDGTMCPSFMATREEKHSTRGRANVLRLAMAGRLGESGLGDEGVRDVLDLCLECRACKAECPVGVDVARFKSEFLADYYRRHGTPLKAGARSAASIRCRRGRAASRRWRTPYARSTAGRWLNEQLFGIDRRRTLPPWTRRTFLQQFRDRARQLAPSHQPRHDWPASSPKPLAPAVVLFTDTFTNYNHPEIGVAAVEVLAAAGVETQLVPHVCCGRPLISQGLLEEARSLAQANADQLYDTAAAGSRILFLEPSCLSAVREDAPALLRGEAQRKARVVADACVLFEDYPEREWAQAGLSIPLRQGPSTGSLHGHCHQKAMGLLPSARALLGRVPSCTVVDLDAGCCGMAGSFGYAREHYDVSRQIGERRLLPAARAMKPDAVLVAAGTSCRHQVEHFAGVKAVHPAVLLRSLLQP
jgi:Fe-S oxidoreductase